MKYRQLTNWDNEEHLQGVIFCAQLLEELLFDYSLDTYKPSAMNTSLLCFEALELISDIEQQNIDKNNLAHVVNELLLNLRKDNVAKSLLSISIDSIRKELSDENSPISHTKTILEIIHDEIRLDKYRKENERLLGIAIKDNNEKNEIRALTRSYITTLINLGYHSNFLYPATLNYFYWRDPCVTSTEDIFGYFELFQDADKEYIALFKASKLFEEINDSCEKMNLKISQTDNDNDAYINKHNFIIDVDSQVYVKVDSIKSKDIFSARESAENQIEILSTLMTLFHHKERPSWDGECLMIDAKNNESRIIDVSMNPMLKCIDMKSKKASKELNKLISNFALHDDSLLKFTRSSELHSLALTSESRENQLLNLWIALETLVPSNSFMKKAKINNIIESMIPFLSLNYIPRLLQKLASDIFNYDRRLFFKYLKKIKGDSSTEKIANLLLLPEYQNIKLELYKDFDQFVLLRNRCHFFENYLNSGKNIKSLLKTHNERIDWQLRRIYRTRNIIVHTGRTPSFTGILIENIHDYLDVLMSFTVMLASNDHKINNLEQVFKVIDIRYKDYLSDLKSNPGNITSENISKLIFRNEI